MTGFLLSTDLLDNGFFQLFLDNLEKENVMFDVDSRWTHLSKSDFLMKMKNEIDCYLLTDDGDHLAVKYYDRDAYPAYDHITFIPLLRNDGSLNVYDYDSMCIPRLPRVMRWNAPTSYVIILAQYAFEGPYYFSDGNKKYGKPEDVICEFKCKIGKYLPEDFNWNSHVGEIRFAFNPIQTETHTIIHSIRLKERR